MTEINNLIEDLSSPDLEQRYFACKNLQGQNELPLEAIYALQEATNDPEPLVSAIAQLILLKHESHVEDSNFNYEPLLDIHSPYRSWELITGLVLCIIIVLLTIPVINIILDDRLNDLWFISLPTLLIAGYLSYLSYQDGRLRPMLALLSSIVVGMLSSIIIFLLFSGIFLMAVSAYFGN